MLSYSQIFCLCVLGPIFFAILVPLAQKHERSVFSSLNEKKVKINQSVQKTFLIIETLHAYARPISLLDLSLQTNLPKATLSRFLYTLMTLGYVEQDSETLFYTLTNKLRHLTQETDPNQRLIEQLHPLLFHLSTTLMEATSLSIRDNTQIVYLDSLDSQERLLTVTQKIGKRAPLYCTGAGKMFLAEISEQQLNDYLATTALVPLTQNTLTEPLALKKELKKIKEQQFALDQEECELGVFCIALPIRNQQNKLLATVSISLPTIRVSQKRIEEVLSYAQKEIQSIFV